MPTKQPNILFIMCDQLAAQALPFYGHPLVQTPYLQQLAARSVIFDAAYCASPLCAPSRFALMSGQLPSRTGAYDNAAHMPADCPTMAHYLRNLGYQTSLVGKMHFVGPDQLHGFEERRTTDIYPADYGWTPDWQHFDERPSWYHNMLSVVQAGTCQVSNQLDYDEEVAFHAVRKLYDLARTEDERPFFLLTSFTHPHDPFAIPPAYWNRYDHAAIDTPRVPPIPLAQMDPHSRRLHHVCAMDDYELTNAHVRNARHAYYGMISYIDDKVGQLLSVLHETGLDENTIIIFTADHGEMLGERGLWYKMSFFEWSARVPLLICAPRQSAAKRISTPVSLIDLLPTLVDLAGGDAGDLAAPVDGHSLAPLLADAEPVADRMVAAEYLAEGAIAPCLMLRHRPHSESDYKYIASPADPEQLYNLAADPHELCNLVDDPAAAGLLDMFRQQAAAHWHVENVHAQVLASQKQRILVQNALMQGQHTSWDFQPQQDASKRYMRNHLDLNVLERTARFPRPDAP